MFATAGLPLKSIVKVVPCATDGTLTHMSDSPDVSHVSISNGIALPWESMKRMSLPPDAQLE